MTTIQATGRRKNASARVRITAGSGKITVNGKTVDEFFGGALRQKKSLLQPLALLPSAKKYDIDIKTTGGGITGQSGAAKMGISRAILKIEPNSKAALKKENLLTRDDRMVERKKPGRPKARKRFQFSKR